MKVKNTVKKSVAFILCLTLIFALAACGSGGKGKVQAEVGKVKIYQGQVDELANLLAVMNSMDLSTLEETEQKEIKNSMLIYLVESELIRADLGSREVIDTDTKKTIDDQIQQLKDSAEVADQLKKAGVSDETVRYYLESNYYSQAFMTKVDEDDPVTDAEIATYFEEHKADFVSSGAIKVSHILMGGPELKDEDRQAITAVRERALAGEDFAALATENSIDTSNKDAGGDLGNVTKGKTTKPFEDAAFALKNGEISEVVETEFGFHIIKAFSDPSDDLPMTLEESSGTIKSILQGQHAQAALEKLKKGDSVKYLVDTDPSTGEPTTGLEDSGTSDENADDSAKEDAEQNAEQDTEQGAEESAE